jgi:peptidase M28-like protein
MRRVQAVLLPLLIVFVVVLWRAQGPEPKSDSAPSREFSAARAMKVLEANLAEGVPHPIASPANVRVRERIEARFRALGYETTIQRRFACNAHAVCATVENVLARVPRSSGPTVLLSAHYDSVSAGPGASDDGMGVAALLEVARAIRGERFSNAVAFLVDDGEEAGLLGAEGFVADAELSRDVRVVINVDNRGTYGVSSMFETSRGNRWLVRHLARSLEQPAASSLFYAIYNLLPNDTDVTVFKRQGTAAMNFAAVRGVQWYHTPLDDLAHANPRTLQHHGDNVLATLRAFADADLDARSKTDATYFDVLGFFLVWWPQEWTLWIAVVSLALLVVAARKTPPREMTFGVLVAFAAIVFAVVGGAALSWLARIRSGGINFAANPWPSVAAMWLAGIAGTLLAASLFRKRSQPRAMLLGIAIVWHTIGIALAITLGGAAFLFVVPALALTVAALAGMSEVPMAAIASTAAGILMFPLGLMLYEALGGRLMIAIAILIGILTTLAAPLFSGYRNALAAAVLAVVCAVIALSLPAYTPERPRALNLAYIDDPAAPGPQWVVDTLTGPLRAAARFSPTDRKLTPWSFGAAWTAPAPREPIPRVTMTGERTAEGVRIHIRSLRGAPRLVLRAHGGTVLRVNGVTPPPRPPRFRDDSRTGWAFASATGVEEMVVDLAANGSVDAVASDNSFGLMAAGAALARARAASMAVPIHEGDIVVTRARKTF